MSKKISQLPVSTTPTSGDILAVINAGITAGIAARYYKNLFDNDAGLNTQRGVSGNLVVSGSAVISGDFLSSGNVKMGFSNSHKVVVVGKFEQSGDSIQSGNAVVTGALYASGDVILGRNTSSTITLSGTNRISGPTTLVGPVTILGTGFIRNNLVVSGSGQFGIQNSQAQSHIFYGLTTFSESGVFQSGLAVLGDVTGQNFNIGGNLNSQKTLTALGDVNLGGTSSNIITSIGSVINTSNFRVDGNSDLRSSLTVRNDLTVSGNTFLGDNGTVDNTIVTGPLQSRSKFMFWSGVEGSGLMVLNSGIIIRHSGAFATGVVISGLLTSYGKSWLGTIQDPTHINGTGFVSGHFVIHGNLNVSGLIYAPGGIVDNTAKRCMFDPQVKVGFENGMFFDSGINKLKFLFWRNGNTTRRVLWNTGDYAANDLVYCSGILNAGSPFSDTLQNRLHTPYNGLFIVESLFNNTAEGGLVLKPTGTLIAPPASAGNNSGAVPYILVHYRSGWLNGVSGIFPVRGNQDLRIGANQGNALNSDYQNFHHRIIFTSQFSNSDYMVQLTCNQGTGVASSIDRTFLTAIPKNVNVSYLDRNLSTEKIVYATVPTLSGTASKGGGADPTIGEGILYNNLNNYGVNEFFAGSPTRVWADFRPI